MGLFKKEKTSPPAAVQVTDGLSAAEAFAGVAMSAMYADGVLAAEEDNELAVYLAQLEVFRGLSDREMRDVFQRVHQLASAEGDAALLQKSAAAVPERLRPTAFLVAADLVMTDGVVGTDERAFLRRVQDALVVDDATAQKILDVLAIKHAA